MRPSSELLGSDGPFVNTIEDFAVRDCQRQMAEAVEQTIRHGGVLVVESGTGTGKTFGYLVPALSSECKIIVSTFTMHLQEQVFKHDIAMVCDTLGLSPRVSMLKGRANYLCNYRYNRMLQQPELEQFDSKTRILERIEDRLNQGSDGELNDFGNIGPELRAKLSSTSDSCLGKTCDYWDECHINRARARAQKADLLVVNHSLLCLDLLQKEETGQGLLPDADVIVVDEAHRLPDVAAKTLGTSVSTTSLITLCDEFVAVGGECALDPDWSAPIESKIRALAQSMQDCVKEDMTLGTLDDLKRNREFMDVLGQTLDALARLVGGLQDLAEEHTQIRQLAESAVLLAHQAENLFSSSAETSADWFERRAKSLEFNRVPLDPGARFGEMVREAESAWVFTSATLAVKDDFSHFVNRVGIESATKKRWDSPFHYREQSLAYLPQDMPEPNSPEYCSRIADLAARIVPVVKGRTFVLCTSRQMVRGLHELLEDRLDYTLLVQGSGASRFEMLREFKSDGNAVLIGTTSFWEGVDVKGETLSCVIIDKLPFVYPGHPLMQARINHIKESAGEPFWDWQVPEAVLSLKQGAGRLIRDINDSGVLVLCDPRLKSKRYGPIFLESLPPMPQTSSFDDVLRFFEHENSRDRHL